MRAGSKTTAERSSKKKQRTLRKRFGKDYFKKQGSKGGASHEAILREIDQLP